MTIKIPAHIKDIAPYEAGKPIEALEREYGISDSIKLASNENPLGPSPKAVAALRGAMENLHRYPDEPGYPLLQRISRYLNVPADQIVVGNGSDDVLGMLALALLEPGDEVIVPTPSFLMYTIVTQSAGATTVKVPLKEMTLDLDAMLAHVNANTRLIFICNPNNPTGTIVSQAAFDTFIKSLPDHVVVVVDEAYIQFVRDEGCLQGIRCLDLKPEVVVLRTFSKAYGLAGLRVGYGVMSLRMAELLNRVRMPFNVNLLAQAAAAAALDDKDFMDKTIALTHQGLDYFYAELDKRRLRYFKSQSNFFLIDLACDAKMVFEKMLRQGVIVRPMSAYGYPQYIRINIGLPQENQRFLDALDSVIGDR